MEQPTLAVVIVNYNTCDDLDNCLRSIASSSQGTSYQVWVVDNDSTDGSADMVRQKFPAVRLIANTSNIGFARSNNLAIRQTKTPYVLLLNPDTLVGDNVFEEAIRFLEKHEDVAVVSCKLIKRDGTLDLACRRSFPSVFDGFCRAVGLSALWPRSRVFARYNLTYLEENAVAEVDAVNGAFMMVRRKAIDEIGLLDEDYFMYMEDLDWCYRFRQKGWRIFYDPSTAIIHLKGQAGKKSSTRMIRAFFDSMELFCRKNYLPRQKLLQYGMTVAGIRVWKFMTLFRNAMREEKRVTP